MNGCSTAAEASPGNAVWCDYIVVYARDTADNQVKAFVVEKDNPGYAATKIGGKMSLRMVQNADIITDCRVSEDARLQNCNSFKDVGKVLAGTRNCVAWGSAGHAVAAYDIALNFALRRKQFGRPIARTQVIQSMLVEMLGDLTSMQLYAIRMARLIDEGKVEETMAALAKYYCTVKGRNVVDWPATYWAATVSCSTSMSCATCATWKPWSPTKELLKSSPSSSGCISRAERVRLSRSVVLPPPLVDRGFLGSNRIFLVPICADRSRRAEPIDENGPAPVRRRRRHRGDARRDPADADVSVGALYHHFPDKPALAAAVYAQVMGEYQAGFVAMLHRHANAAGGIRCGVAPPSALGGRQPQRSGLAARGDRLDSAELREAKPGVLR